MNDLEEHVILVDRSDAELGVMGKMEAHQQGVLHRAFSVFLFDDNGRLLLQQRALTKYHTPGLWTNTCCSHPRPGEALFDAAHRRLQEEMGIVNVALRYAFPYYYEARLSPELIEHELDHVLVGCWQQTPEFNPVEVNAIRWAEQAELDLSILEQPNQYTPWFKGLTKKVHAFWTQTL